MAIPAEALDADLCDVSAETAVALEQSGFDTRPGRGERGGQAPGPRSHHQDVGLVHDGSAAGWFLDRSGQGGGVFGSGRIS